MEVTFPGMSGDFTSENFSATWYLIENHSGSRLVIVCLSDFVPLSLSAAYENIIMKTLVCKSKAALKDLKYPSS